MVRLLPVVSSVSCLVNDVVVPKVVVVAVSDVVVISTVAIALVSITVTVLRLLVDHASVVVVSIVDVFIVVVGSVEHSVVVEIEPSVACVVVKSVAKSVVKSVVVKSVISCVVSTPSVESHGEVDDSVSPVVVYPVVVNLGVNVSNHVVAGCVACDDVNVVDSVVNSSKAVVPSLVKLVYRVVIGVGVVVSVVEPKELFFVDRLF